MQLNNDVLILLPPSQNRLDSLKDVLSGRNRAERYLFYGLDFFIGNGVSCVHNIGPVLNMRWMRIIAQVHRRLFSRLFIHHGEIEWVLPVFKYLFRARLIFIYSERIMFCLLYWRMLGLLPRRPTVLIPMGLPEKLKDISSQRPGMLRFCLNELQKVEQIVCISKLEAEVLCSEFGLVDNVRFIRVGVDSDYFHPIPTERDVDVLSIGADKFRDFSTLFNVADRLPDISFRVITSQSLARSFCSVPYNVEVLTNIPMDRIRGHMARGRILSLPVFDNTYSGATTVLLQAMAMEKAVIANRAGSNASGYPFESGRNLMYVDPQDSKAMEDAIMRLIKDDVLRNSIGSLARKTIVRELNLIRFHKELYEIMNSVCLKSWGMGLKG